MLKEVDCTKFYDGKFVESKHKVVEEEALSIFINGRYFATAMISPQMKKEFVIGHLFAEGIISDIGEIESLQLEDNIAKVITANSMKVQYIQWCNLYLKFKFTQDYRWCPCGRVIP